MKEKIIKKGTRVFITQYNEVQVVDHDIHGDTRFSTNNKKHSYGSIGVIKYIANQNTINHDF